MENVKLIDVENDVCINSYVVKSSTVKSGKCLKLLILILFS